jgi:hypothetical protein
LERIEEKYGLKLPRKVITVDYGDDVGDLFIRFKHVEHMEGEPTEDGRVILHYDEKEEIAAVEIIDITAL